MENRSKLQISKAFQAAFGCCWSKNNSVSVSNRRLIDLFSPKTQPLSCSPEPHLSPANTDQQTPHSISPLHEKSSKRGRKKPHYLKRRNITDNYYNAVAVAVAVAKESSDPREDFKVSMVDMIVENGIITLEELEKLVIHFLSLNSEEHHKVIVEVFAEIRETLVIGSGYTMELSEADLGDLGDDEAE